MTRAGEDALDGLDGVRQRVEKTVIRDAQGSRMQTIGRAAARHVFRTNQVRFAVPSSAR
ncbi:TPA: hypothetical protein ACUNF5_005447 [Burkholderia orbicola]